MALQGHYYNLVLKQGLTESEDVAIQDPVEANSETTMAEDIPVAVSDDEKDIELGDSGVMAHVPAKLSQWPVLRAMKLNIPEWYLILPGVLAALVSGAVFPIFTIVRVFYKFISNSLKILSEVTNILLFETGDELTNDVAKYSLYFLLVAIGAGIAGFVNVW